MQDITLTPEEAAELLRVPVTMVYRALRAGRLPGIMVRGSWRILRSDVEEQLREGFYNVAGEE